VKIIERIYQYFDYTQKDGRNVRIGNHRYILPNSVIINNISDNCNSHDKYIILYITHNISYNQLCNGRLFSNNIDNFKDIMEDAIKSYQVKDGYIFII
jgi:hypothetical protein